MARKACNVSLRKGVSRTLIIRTRGDGAVFANNKTTALSNESKRNGAMAAGVNKSTKKRARKKIQRQRRDKLKRACDDDAVTNSSDHLCRSSAPFKSVPKKRRVAGGNENTTCSGDFDSGVDDAGTIEIVSVCQTAQSAISEVVQEQQADKEPVAGLATATNDFPKSWTEEMIRYYFQPNEERKSFDYVKIMENIEYKAADWWISDADRTNNGKRREFFQRCAKCNRKGHTKKECKKHVVCHVCGEFNHGYSECPNAVCLTCGRATKKYSNNCCLCRKILSSRKTCMLCGQIWHEETLCPSNWRKYSMVASSTRDSAIRLNSRKCCYNCAQRGHFGFECPLVSQSEYPPENPLKTAFPLEKRRRFVSGDDGEGDLDLDIDIERSCDQANKADTIDNDHIDSPRVHVIFLAKRTSDILFSEMGKHFLTNLSRNTNIRIELFRGKRSYIKLFGDLKIVEYCKCQLLKWRT